MRFETWEPVYRRILDDFGFERADDEASRDLLASVTEPFDHTKLAFLNGATVAICGAGPNLAEELDATRDADAVVAASTAADVCLDAGIDVDLLVTDLDKNPETARALTEAGVPVAAHAHGDNRHLVGDVVPTFDPEWTLPTTQAAPTPPVENFGGFTDGDRAAFLADHFGAATLRFVGWDFDDPSVDPMKRRKLVWAERLCYWLEQRRGERFALLDGRRDVIDTSVLPR
ncbi:6-hydroxymethylpterin diphosphokinase MptE-like protein [Halorarius litoreus]|uniref:6-hydroxymethylpterin diphosphokinase MptE-like protein n=1 Tax=Halorarius litoreus TaxID=2962676 RepID=UPI0020CEA96E|nr:6-hydroxymethylpterin diphosphokinase MptE-like protein [Halorarius litoreus]